MQKKYSEPLIEWQNRADKTLAEMQSMISQLKSGLVEIREFRQRNPYSISSLSQPWFVRDVGKTADRIAATVPVLNRIAKALESAQGAGNSGFPIFEGRPIGWIWLSQALPGGFIQAIRSTNPTFTPGLGHTGPVARFLAAVIPTITGERPTPESVSTQLKKIPKGEIHQ